MSPGQATRRVNSSRSADDCPRKLTLIMHSGLDARSPDQPQRPDCDLLFTTPTGRMWRERNFYRDLWKPTQEASGLDIRPHECSHSYVTHLRAAGINDADLAEIAGHWVETMLARYAHAVGHSFQAVRATVG